MARKDKYYAVNKDCADFYTNLKDCIREIKKGYLGNERTIIYKLPKDFKEVCEVSQLSFDDEVMEFENCKLVEDWRK